MKIVTTLYFFILFFVASPSDVFSQEDNDSLFILSMNQEQDSLAYLDAVNDIYIYDLSGNKVDVILKEYRCESETAQVKILNFNSDYSVVNISFRSHCAYQKKDSVFLKKCQIPLDSVKISSKYLLTYIHHPKIYDSPLSNRKLILDLVSNSDGIWPHIRDTQIIEIKPEWYKVKFKYKEKSYSGWVPAAWCCPMTFSSCG